MQYFLPYSINETELFAVLNLFPSLSLLPILTDFNAETLSSFLNSPWHLGLYQATCVGKASSDSKSLQFLPYYPACLIFSPFCSELWLFSGLNLENLLIYSSRFSPFACFESKAILQWSALFSICPICFMSSKNSSLFWFTEDAPSCSSDVIFLFFQDLFWEKEICVLNKLFFKKITEFTYHLLSVLFSLLFCIELLHSVLHKKIVEISNAHVHNFF